MVKKESMARREVITTTYTSQGRTVLAHFGRPRPGERGIRPRGPDYIYALESMAKYRPMRKSTRGLVKVQSLGMPNFQMALSDTDRTSILWTWRTSLPQPATCLDHGSMASTPSGLSPTASDGMDVDSPSKCRSKSRAKHWTSSD